MVVYCETISLLHPNSLSLSSVSEDDYMLRVILLLPPSRLSPFSGRVDDCMLWSNLVAAFEWVVSIFRMNAWLYVTDVSTAIERCMIKRIK